jgi:hypothetical protein
MPPASSQNRSPPAVSWRFGTWAAHRNERQESTRIGVPLVLRPVLADRPWNARRVASAGAGLVIEDPAEAGRPCERC